MRLHTYCVAQRLGNDGRCPDHLDESKASPCQQCVLSVGSGETAKRGPSARADSACESDPRFRIWPRDLTTRKFYGVPIGVAALEENNVDSGDDDDSGDDEE